MLATDRDERIGRAVAVEDRRPVLVVRTLDDVPATLGAPPRRLVRVGGWGYPTWIAARRALDRVVYEQRHGYGQRVVAYGYLLLADDEVAPRWVGLYLHG